MNLNEADTRAQLIEPKLKAAGGAGRLHEALDQVPVPKPTEQHRIADYLDGVQAQVAELKRLQAASASGLEWLGGAVLARAFRGEL